MWKRITFVAVILLAECFLSQPGWALDWLVFNTVSPDDPERKANEAVAEQYMEDFRKNYPDLTIVTVKNGRSQVTYKSENATGKNRIIYVDGSTNSQRFLQHIDGSSDTKVDRRDKNRKIKDILFLGHGSAEGPQTFAEETRKDTHGAMAWQKNFTDWERELAKEGKSPSDFFCRSPSITFGNCNVGTSVFPHYVANILPSEGKVYAADTLVEAGSPGWFGRKDLYLYKEGKSVPFPVFRPGEKGKTNSELTLERELSFFYREIEQTRDLFSGVTEQNKNGFLTMFAKYYTDVKDFEPGNVRDELVKIINNLQSKVRDLTLTRKDLDAFLKEINNLRKGESTEESSAVTALREATKEMINMRKKLYEARYAFRAIDYRYERHRKSCPLAAEGEPCPTCEQLKAEYLEKNKLWMVRNDEFSRFYNDYYLPLEAKFCNSEHPELDKREITTWDALDKYLKDHNDEDNKRHNKYSELDKKALDTFYLLFDNNLTKQGDTPENRELLRKINKLREERDILKMESWIKHAESDATYKRFLASQKQPMEK